MHARAHDHDMQTSSPAMATPARALQYPLVNGNGAGSPGDAWTYSREPRGGKDADSDGAADLDEGRAAHTRGNGVDARAYALETRNNDMYHMLSTNMMSPEGSPIKNHLAVIESRWCLECIYVCIVYICSIKRTMTISAVYVYSLC
jgi:hypothetical protein